MADTMDFRFLRHLWYFLAVAEERHFGKAAARLGISQPPLSQQIQTLEQVLGVELFDRTKAGVRLTQEGMAILPEVKRLADHAQRLEVLVREARNGAIGSITIGAITSAMFEVLPNFLKSLRAEHPRVLVSLIEMDTADALSSLEAGDIDLAFVRSHHDVGAIKVAPLVKDQLAVALSPEHPLARRQSIGLAELAEEPTVLFARRISPAYFDSIVSACHLCGFAPKILHEASSVYSQIGFVACGLGIALVPSGAVRREMTGVVIRRLESEVDLITIAIAWNAARAPAFTPSLIDMAVSSNRGADDLPH